MVIQGKIVATLWLREGSRQETGDSAELVRNVCWLRLRRPLDPAALA